MFLDFLLGLVAGMLSGLSDALPSNSDFIVGGLPPVVVNSLSLVFFYIDPTPVGILISAVVGVFGVFVSYKIFNLVFGWVSGLL